MPTSRMLRFFAASMLGAAAAAAAQAPTAYTRHTSAELRQFGSEAEFLRYLEEARAAAHARGHWWYAGLRVQFAQAGMSDTRPMSLEILPGSHGDYDFDEADLPDGGRLYYSNVDLTMIRPGVEIVWPGARRRGKVLAGDSLGPPHDLYPAARRNRLWDPAEIHRPVRDTLEPTVHSITICPPRAVRRGRPEGCRTTAFVGPRGGELHVTGTHAFVWTVPEYGDLEAVHSDPACARRVEELERSGLPSLVYRMPLAGGPLEVLGTRGAPAWGSGFHVAGDRLRAMVAWPDLTCGERTRPEPGAPPPPPARLTLLDAPLDLFARRLEEAPRAHEAALPMTGSEAIRVRFTGGWLLYGDLAYEFEVPWDAANLSGRLFAVPLARPADARTIALPHNLVSIGEAGSRAFVTGYRSNGGLEMSVVELDDPPRIVSSLHLPGVRQQTGIMEVIPTTVRRDGSVLIALPTAPVREYPPEGSRDFRPGSPVYLVVDRSGQIRPR